MDSEIGRTTMYLDPNLLEALRRKSIETSRSVSELVNEAICESLADDGVDPAAFEDRGDEALIVSDEGDEKPKEDGLKKPFSRIHIRKSFHSFLEQRPLQRKSSRGSYRYP